MDFMKNADPWALLSAIFAILILVETRFAFRSDYDTQRMHDQLMEERYKGYDMAVRQQREKESLAASKALELEG